MNTWKLKIVGPAALAAALATPAGPVFAESIDIVTSRAPNMSTLDYGRATPAEFWQREQLESAPGNTPGTWHARNDASDSPDAAYTADVDNSSIERGAEKSIVLEQPGDPALVPNTEGSQLSAQSGEASATDNSGYTEHPDPERTPNEAPPMDQTGDASASDNSGYTDEQDPAAMPNDSTGSETGDVGDAHNVHGSDTGMSSGDAETGMNSGDKEVGDMQHSDGERFDQPDGAHGQSELPQQ
jgi:hypothetical protein